MNSKELRNCMVRAALTLKAPSGTKTEHEDFRQNETGHA